MLSNEKTIDISESEINEIARKYSEAKKNKSDSDEKNYKLQLYLIITTVSVLYKKLYSAFKEKKHLESDDSIKQTIEAFCWKPLNDYDYEKNNNFCAYMLTYANYYQLDALGAEWNVSSLDKPISSPDDSESGKSLNDFIPDEESDIEEMTDINLRNKLMWIRISSLVIGFYEHFQDKEANPTKLSYFRIFVTETYIEYIKEPYDLKNINCAEAYASTDKQYVRFISFSEYERFEDILSLKYKKYSDVIANYPGKDKELKVPCQNRVIAEYRFYSGLDEKRVSDSAISLQRSSYKEKLKEKLNFILDKTQ